MTFSEGVKRNLRSQYTNSLVTDFYQPLLSEADLYQRVSGYFSSAGIDLYADGLEELAKNSGRVQFIISKEISSQDFQKIKDGYDLLSDLKPLGIAERNERLTSKTQKSLGNLAFMIAMGQARVKIALTNQGIFHDKFGIITSGKECVFFNGSANETKNGISENYESISVDVSWDNSNKVQSRIKSNAERFERLWNDNEPNVKVVEASEVAYEEIAKFQTQSTIQSKTLENDSARTSSDESTISFRLINSKVVRLDHTPNQITKKDRKLRLGSDIAKFFEKDNQTVKSEVTYKDIERVIDTTRERAKRKNIKVEVSSRVSQFIARNKYSIEQYKILGEVYKGNLSQFPDNIKATFNQFSKVVQSAISRPLRNLHLRAAFFEYEMERAANFSVPGAGKTAMMLGVFAYLNQASIAKNEYIKRILVVSPINAFDSWKREFKAVFGSKKKLKVFDSQNSKNFKNKLKTDWAVSNLVLINYEALQSNLDVLSMVLDNQTMLVFDEVHRIKNPTGIRAEAALKICAIPKFRYVMTGTPIPNTYQDIYNFLHILYGNEYNSFFGWDPKELAKPSIRKINEINKKIFPFFWRTNKTDLKVPPAEPDILKVVTPSKIQKDLAEEIYYNESSSLAILIRLIQASSNPSLLNSTINYNELMSYDDEGDIKSISEEDFNRLLGSKNLSAVPHTYEKTKSSKDISPKFQKGIELVSSLVSQGKKVMVWGIFVDTLNKISDFLSKLGIKNNLVYGATDKVDRVKLIDDFRDGDVQVLISNPQTLGESISLHQTVHDAVYFEYNFNLTFMLQSRDRIHRLGLSPNQYTRYYYLQTKGEDILSDKPGYIDEKIYSRLKDKEQLMYEAIDNNKLSIEYTDAEIQDAIKIIDEERERVEHRHG